MAGTVVAILRDLFGRSDEAEDDVIPQRNLRRPASPRKEDISTMWRRIQGSDRWAGLLDPLHPWLRQEIIKYGEFAQATYDAFDFDQYSRFPGTCRYNKGKLFRAVELERSGYVVTKYLYTTTDMELPEWLARVFGAEDYAGSTSWMGYVAVSDEEETRRIGRRDVVVVWRGTVTPSEWGENIKADTVEIEEGDAVKVEHGFWSIYTTKPDSGVLLNSSAQEQVMLELDNLLKPHLLRREEVSITITGHSLGGALALLTARDAAISFPSVPTAVFTFGSPMVGNDAFVSLLDRLGVRALRMVNEQDLVPKLPGRLAFFAYEHGGEELRLDVAASPYLKDSAEHDIGGTHGLETYLHLVDGYEGKDRAFRAGASRDVALVNKSSDMLKEELRVPSSWLSPENKGMVLNPNGRWVLQDRAEEDVPSRVEWPAPSATTKTEI